MQLRVMDKNNLAFTCITREENENLGLGGRTRIHVMRRLQFLKAVALRSLIFRRFSIRE
jgi:hypothetical protein